MIVWQYNVLRLWFIAFASLVALTGPSLHAQSSLFSIPTTDVVDEKGAYLEFDFVSHLESHRNGGFQAYTGKSVFGVHSGLEAGVNVTFADSLEPNQPIEVQPNLKWRFYDDEKSGLAAAAGGILFTPVNHRSGADSLGLIYTVLSKQVSHLHAARLTGGTYCQVGQESGSGSVCGAIAGYEQPLSHRVTFIVDWISGNNRFGYASPGLAFSITKKSTLNIAYNIGNEGRKNNSLYVTYGYLF